MFRFDENDDFWNGLELEQGPLWFLQSHVSYTCRPGLWAGASGGFAHGGKSARGLVDLRGSVAAGGCPLRVIERARNETGSRSVLHGNAQSLV